VDGQEPPASPQDEGSASGRFQVEITGGKGAVVGDYATVFQVFTQSSTPLSSLIRSRDFQALVDERTRNFVGRDFIFSGIDAAFEDENFPSGYVVILGEPGIGKTALTGQLVRERGYVHHFNVAPLGIRSPQAFLSNVCAQLIVRYELDFPGLPPEATQDGGFLSRLLAEVAANPEHLPVVVVVDALDEAEDVGLPPGANRLFLPPTLPFGVFFVVSTRPEYDYRLFVDPRWPDIYLRDDDPQNLEDVRSYIRDYLGSTRETMASQIERWDVSEDAFIDLITAKSEGNFMYLVHVLRDIRSGALNAETVGDIQKLPQGLKDYYRRHWNDMRSADQELFRRYQQPVVCLLATVREPVSRAQLLEWTGQFWSREGWDPATLDRLAVQDVLNAWHEFLNEDTVDGETRYRVYHASFQDFLAEEVGLTVYHETISETALAKIPGFLADS
jgi:hypothetical protein